MRANTIVRRLVLVALLLVPGAATAADLDGFLGEIDVRARADLGSFKTDLRVAFGVSDGKVDGLFAVMSRPSDVYMCLRLGEVTRLPVDRVVEEYEHGKARGWGAIAKNLGIKPGSAEFHALKAGRLAKRAGGPPASKGKGAKR